MTNSMIERLGALTLGLVGVAACSSVAPYDSDFSCKNDDYGQCIRPMDAYAVAVGTERTSIGSDAVNASENTRKWRHKPGDRGPGRSPSTLVSADGASVPAYTDYQSQLYREVASLLEQPATPMITQAITVRTLILPYADEQENDLLFMPRFVYSIIEGPRFVMGNYLAKHRSHSPASFLASGRSPKDARPELPGSPRPAEDVQSPEEGTEPRVPNTEGLQVLTRMSQDQ